MTGEIRSYDATSKTKCIQCCRWSGGLVFGRASYRQAQHLNGSVMGHR